MSFKSPRVAKALRKTLVQLPELVTELTFELETSIRLIVCVHSTPNPSIWDQPSVKPPPWEVWGLIEATIRRNILAVGKGHIFFRWLDSLNGPLGGPRPSIEEFLKIELEIGEKKNCKGQLAK